MTEMPFVDPHMLASGWGGEAPPLMLVALDGGCGDGGDLRLPPCPVIGVGDPSHPLARRLDAVIEPPVTLASLVDAVRAQPAAASILVQLLRAIDALPVEAALVQESIAYGLLQGSAAHAAWLAARPVIPMAAPGSVHLDREDDRLTIRLDRPAARNAIDRPMRDALHEAFTIAALDPDIREVVLLGEGRAFSVGADLSEFGTTRDPAEAHRIRMATLPAHAIIRCRDRLSVHVTGGCVGAGLEMAAFATRLTASADAWFQLPELAMGLIPGAGGCVSVARRIGRQRAGLMILSGRRISARTALSWGLVDALVDERATSEGRTHIAGEEA